VGIKLPYFAFWAKPDYTGELKKLPPNMYVAMALAASLCLAQGLYPQMLYRLLPFPVEYTPYTAWSLLQAFMLLGFTGLGFYFVRRIIKPHAGRNLDFDGLYRLVGNAVLKLVCAPLGWLDNRWTEVYRVAGLRGLLGTARASSWFDKKGIDTVVDGAAYGVREVGRSTTRVQTGRLQDYLAWMPIILFGICVLVWWLA
jgi:multicomponent Na+:H+ antiporter subunit D